MYYQFNFIPAFWERLGQEITCGKIAILDLVKKEIERGKDDLSKWLGDIRIGRFIDRRNKEIIAAYQAVLEHLRTNPCYKPNALMEWSKATAADPWLLASAKVFELTIVTFESSNHNLNHINPSKRAFIPDVAKVFDIKVCNLFEMMTDLNFTLR